MEVNNGSLGARTLEENGSHFRVFLMYVNNVMSAEEFNMQLVVVPSMSAVVDMLQDKFPQQPVENLFEVNW